MTKTLSWSVSGLRMKRGLGRAGLYLLLIALGVIFAFPLFWTVSSSLKTAPEMFAYPPPLFPKSPQWVNYKRVFTLFRYTLEGQAQGNPIAEHIKDVHDRPYIPGSSLKGAIRRQLSPGAPSRMGT